jgi:hypothetical protein
MSHVTSVFIAKQVPTAEICRLFEADCGILLFEQRDGDRTYFERNIFGVFVTVCDCHEYEDNLGIAFSQFPIEVSFKRYAGAWDVDLRTNLCRTMAKLFAQLASQRLQSTCIVVDDLQQMVASYRDGEQCG